MKREEARKRLCVALDVDSLSEAQELVTRLKNCVGMFKVGSQLFTQEGPRVIDAIRNAGGKVFLDLKFHDIPNTVASTARMAVRIGAFMFNMHTSGGSEMMRLAVEAAEDESQRLNVARPITLGVTVLTSINQETLNKELIVGGELPEHVVHLARMAKSSGLSGVVASPKEIGVIRKACGNGFVILTPGIRPSWASTADDQKRIMTPGEAIRMGANYIVVGRPILNADDPCDASEKILKEMESVND
jgi:orotidine-5'-phosphate decarboxylase